MCIRDSSYKLVYLHIENQLTGLGMYDMINKTILHVYKSGGETMKKKRMIAVLLTAAMAATMFTGCKTKAPESESTESKADSGKKAVSYTHLDVYKRQLLPCVYLILTVRLHAGPGISRPD